MEINTKVNIKMTKGMAKVFTTMPMEINVTKVNIKMTKRMAKVFSTMPVEINTKVNIKMTK
jgi:hypothetical protein